MTNLKKLLLCTLLTTGGQMASAQTANFGYFSYQGNDSRFAAQIDHNNQYLNPIVSGYYPDPSVCRVGDTYYLVNSSFSYFPGVPIFTSTDLVNWHQMGHVLDRKSQLPLAGQNVSQGIFAPQITYNKRNKTYYMTTMNMGIGDVFYVKSQNPAKGWSEPIHLKKGGMDTSFFFDNDGKAYLVYNSNPFGKQKYEGEMAIHMNEFDWKGDSVKLKTYELVRSGTHCIKDPVWIEGPHLYHIGKYYYLMAAEGGTSTNHSEVIFRGKSVYGPWEEFEGNPIITQRDLTDANRENPVICTGHADLVQAKDGQWWAVFLGCRPYDGSLYNTGRETFLLPVTWRNGWPMILEHAKAVPTVVNKKGLIPTENNYVTGNYAFTDRFDGGKLDYRWIFLRNPDMNNFQLNGHGITIKALPTNIKEKDSPAAVFYRQKHETFTAETEVDFAPTSDNELAGFTLFQNGNYNFVFGKTLIDGKPALTLSRTEKETVTVGTTFLSDAKANKPIKLKIEGNGKYYSFYYSTKDNEWETLAQGVDATNLSTDKAGGFVGTEIGLYATAKK